MIGSGVGTPAQKSCDPSDRNVVEEFVFVVL